MGGHPARRRARGGDPAHRAGVPLGGVHPSAAAPGLPVLAASAAVIGITSVVVQLVIPYAATLASGRQLDRRPELRWRVTGAALAPGCEGPGRAP